MIITYCGLDTITSRNNFLNEINKYKEKGYEIKNIYPKEINEIYSNVLTQNLFGQEIIYRIENLNKYINKKSTNVINMLKKLSLDKNILILDWENEIEKRQLKFIENIKIFESKPTRSIFKLLDQCYPSNLKEFMNTLNEVCNKNNEYFVFVMLVRHIKQLLLYKINVRLKNLAYWQEKKLILQSKLWSKDALINYYDKLLNIEIQEKSGKNPFGLKNYIEMLSCYYIK